MTLISGLFLFHSSPHPHLVVGQLVPDDHHHVGEHGEVGEDDGGHRHAQDEAARQAHLHPAVAVLVALPAYREIHLKVDFDQDLNRLNKSNKAANV